jgi:hypothetical protein
MGCLNKHVEDVEVVVCCGESTEDVDGVRIAEINGCCLGEVGDAMVSTCGEFGAAGAESVRGIEEITGNGPGGETGVEPGVGSDD